MARSIGGRSYSTTFLVLVSESICSLLNRLAQRAPIQFWAERQHTGTRCHAPPGSGASFAVQVPKLCGQNKKSRGIMTRRAMIMFYSIVKPVEVASGAKRF